MRVKIRFEGATPDSELDLCLTCSQMTRYVQFDGKEVRRCDLLDWRSQPSGAVSWCSGYKHKSDTSLSEMKETAWILRTDRYGKRIGFKPYRSLKESERFYLDEE
jgi:hypothetical protein